MCYQQLTALSLLAIGAQKTFLIIPSLIKMQPRIVLNNSHWEVKIVAMKVVDFVKLAQKAQHKLKELGWPAEHIYLMGYSDPRTIPSLIFVSPNYNSLDLYNRARLSLLIQQGPLKFNYYVISPSSILSSSGSIKKEDLYRAIKIYGKTPLMLNNFEYASKKDLEFSQATT